MPLWCLSHRGVRACRMRDDLIVLAVVTVLGIRSLRRGDLAGYVLVAAGAAMEVLADTVTVMGAGGLLVALGVTLRGGRRGSAGYVAFGSLFVFLLGASFAVRFTGTETVRSLRHALGGVPTAVARGAVLTVWTAVLMRLALLPVVRLPTAPSSGLVAIGPAWWSAGVLAARWADALPQALVDSCRAVCAPVTAIILIAATVGAFGPRALPGMVEALAAGAGALATLGMWCGGQVGLGAGRLLLASTAIAGCALGGGSRGRIWVVPYAAVALLTMGFPGGAGFAARLQLIAGIGGIRSTVGVVALLWWVLPLVGWMRHGSWNGVHRASAWTAAAVAVGLWGALAGGLLLPGCTP